jgi:hypothetical protein
VIVAQCARVRTYTKVYGALSIAGVLQRLFNYIKGGFTAQADSNASRNTLFVAKSVAYPFV